jgi:hypothetical protein
LQSFLKIKSHPLIYEKTPLKAIKIPEEAEKNWRSGMA